MKPQLLDRIKLFILHNYSKNSYNINYLNKVNIPSEPCVFAFNHGTAFDGPLVNQIRDDLANNLNSFDKKRFSRMLSGSDCLRFKEKILFFLMNWIPIDRTNKKETSKGVELMHDRLNKGYDIIIFPEATWNVSSELVKPFHKGVGLVSYIHGCSVIPCAIFRKNEKDFYVEIGDSINISNYTSNWEILMTDIVNKIIEKSNNKKDIIDSLNSEKILIGLTNLKESLIGTINNVTLDNNWKDSLRKDFVNNIKSYDIIKRVEMFLYDIKKNYNIKEVYVYYFLNIDIPDYLMVKINAYLCGNYPKAKLIEDMLSYITPIEITDHVERTIASLYGNMMFNDNLQNKVSRAEINPEMIREELLKEENGFKMEYDYESNAFHRKKTSYYSYFMNEKKDFISEEQIYRVLKK